MESLKILLVSIVLIFMAFPGASEGEGLDRQEHAENTAQKRVVHAVQVAAYQKRRKAEVLLRKLEAEGLRPHVLVMFDRAHRKWFSVQVGEFSSRRAAERFRKAGGVRVLAGFVFSMDEISFNHFKSRYDTETDARAETVRPGLTVGETPPTAREEAASSDDQPVNQPEDLVAGNEAPESFVEKAPEPSPAVVPQVKSSNEVKTAWLSRNDRGWYIVAGVGFSRVDVKGADLDRHMAGQGLSTSTNIDRTNMGWKLVGGYKFTKNLGLEGGYLNLGRVSTHVQALPGGTANVIQEATQVAPVSIHGVVLEGVGSWNISPRFSLLGKAGAFLWQGETDIGGTGAGTSQREEDGVDWVAGVGWRYRLDERHSLIQDADD